MSDALLATSAVVAWIVLTALFGSMIYGHLKYLTRTLFSLFIAGACLMGWVQVYSFKHPVQLGPICPECHYGLGSARCYLMHNPLPSR